MTFERQPESDPLRSCELIRKEGFFISPPTKKAASVLISQLGLQSSFLSRIKLGLGQQSINK